MKARDAKGGNERFAVKRTSTGLGLVARKPIRRGGFVIEYTGTLVPNTDTRRLKGRYLFEVDGRWTIDGSDRRNLSRYINHSCRPNCRAYVSGRRIVVHALRSIVAGEELCYDYGKAYFEEFIKPRGCACAHCAPSSPFRSATGLPESPPPDAKGLRRHRR